MKSIIIAAIFVLLLTGCGLLENSLSNQNTVDLLGLDYSACVDGFDTCFEFLMDNDEVLLGKDVNSNALSGAILSY